MNPDGKNIVLIYSHHVIIQRLLNKLVPGKTYFWIYLGQDIALCSKIGKIMTGKVKRLPIGDQLQNVAKQYRQQYIDYIGSISQGMHHREWWLTSLSEKNPNISTFFLNFCSIKICEQLVDEEAYNLIVVCESRALMRSLVVNLRKRSDLSVVVIDSSLRARWDKFHTILKQFSGKLVFTGRFLGRIALSRIFRVVLWFRRSTDSRRFGEAIIFSWVDKRSFSDQGDHKETYLGNVHEDVEIHGWTHGYIVSVLPTIWYPAALLKLYRSNANALPLEVFLKFRDILSALRDGCYLPNLSGAASVLDSTEISDILKDELVRDQVNYRVEISSLYYYAGIRLAAQHHPSLFLFPFENHTWEKMICIGIKSSSPDSKCIGFAHLFINRMYTCYSRSRHEQAVVPLPDFIVVNNQLSKETLTNSGFDPDTILIGKSYRYQNLFKPIAMSPVYPQKTDRSVICVALSAGAYDALELLYKTVVAFQAMTDVEILIKCHPTLPIEVINKYLPDLPSHFQITEKMLGELLPNIDLLLYTESTASIEALVMDIPVIHIRSDHRIDINILDEFNFPSFSKAEEISGAATRLLHMRKTQPLEYRSTLLKIFAPNEDSVFDYFRTEVSPERS